MMRAVVLSHEDDGTYVLTPGGRIKFLARKLGEVGQEVVLPIPTFTFKRVMMASAACLVIFLCTSMWFVEGHTLYIDLNPSLLVRFNLLGRAMSAQPLNEAGAALLDGTSVSGKVENVLLTLFDYAHQEAFVSEDPIMLISTVTRTRNHEARLLGRVAELFEADERVYVHVQPAREYGVIAREHGVSPGAYFLAEMRGDGDAIAHLGLTLRELLGR